MHVCMYTDIHVQMHLCMHTHVIHVYRNISYTVKTSSLLQKGKIAETNAMILGVSWTIRGNKYIL